MCAKAIIDARIDEVIFAAPEPKTGSIISIDNIYEELTSIIKHHINMVY
jgi:tRNA(Arg) A34 adenosine deaminase TadA